MEKVYEELEDAKAEVEKLKAEYRVKTNLCENLKRSHNEQLKKLQEANVKIERQAEELSANADELCSANNSLTDLKCIVKEKEGIIKGLTASYDKLRFDFNEKLKKCEEEKGEVVLLLEEANIKNLDLEKNIRAHLEEIELLKEGLISVSNRKCSATSRMAKVSQDIRERDDTLSKVEEENRKLEEELKWKKEQFKHLEEAHLKLRDHLLVKEKEWDKEKSELLDEISKLQTNLDSLTRVSDGLQRRLEACNQALAHEETRRKCLEVQLSESKSSFNNIYTECEEAKLKLEGLTQRDKDVAFLRNLLGDKESSAKEMEYRIGKLEEENLELKCSLKEVRDLQIQEAGASSSLSKLRNRLKSLDKIHKDFLEKTKEKEAQWSFRLEKAIEDLDSCRYELEHKESLLKELKMELDDCNSLALDSILQKEEAMIMLLIMQYGLLEVQVKMDNERTREGLINMEREVNMSLLVNKLETKNTALIKAQEYMEEEESKKVKSLKMVEEEKLLLQKEIEGQNQQLLQMKVDFRSVCDLLDSANEELAQKLCEENEAEFELQMWKAAAEQEMEYRIGKLEEENLELKCSLKEVRDLQIQEAGASSSLSKLRNRLKTLDKIHKDFLEKTKEKETQLSFRLEKAIEDLDSCRYELEHKESNLKELKMELDDCNSHALDLILQKEEAMIMLLIMQSGLLEVQVKMDDERTREGLINMEREVNMSLLVNELETKNAALIKAQEYMEEEESRKVKSLKMVEEEKLLLQKEIEGQNQQLLQMKVDFRSVCDLLDSANEELAQKLCEENEAEFELQMWKAAAEQLKSTLEQSHQMRKEVEASVLAQVAIEIKLKEEKDCLFHVLKEKERRIHDLEREVEWWEKEWLSKEIEGAILAEMDEERVPEHEKSMNELVEEKDQRIDTLQQTFRSLQEEFDHSTSCFSSELVKMQKEVGLLHEAWENIATTQFLKEIEIQEKNLIISELEDDLSSLRKNFDSEKRNLLEYVMILSDRISDLLSEDVEMMQNLGRMMTNFNEKENKVLSPIPTRKTVIQATSLDGRSPLRALN